MACAQDYNRRIRSTLTAEKEANLKFQRIIEELSAMMNKLNDEERAMMDSLSRFMSFHHSMDLSEQSASYFQKLTSLMNSATAERTRKSILFCGMFPCHCATFVTYELQGILLVARLQP